MPTPQPGVVSLMAVRACVVSAPWPLPLSPGLHEICSRETQASSFCFHDDSWPEAWRLSWLCVYGGSWFPEDFPCSLFPQIPQDPDRPRHHSLVSGHCLEMFIPVPSTDPPETFWLLLPILSQGLISPAVESSVKLLDSITAEAALY